MLLDSGSNSILVGEFDFTCIARICATERRERASARRPAQRSAWGACVAACVCYRKHWLRGKSENTISVSVECRRQGLRVWPIWTGCRARCARPPSEQTAPRNRHVIKHRGSGLVLYCTHLVIRTYTRKYSYSNVAPTLLIRVQYICFTA